jgi:hypothetical protein
MAIAQTITLKSTTGGETLSGAVTLTDGARTSISEVLSGGNESIALEIDVSALKSIFVLSNEDVSVQFEGPDLNFELVAGKPFVWYVGCYHSNPFSEDVASLSVSSSGGALLQVEMITDPTP